MTTWRSVKAGCFNNEKLGSIIRQKHTDGLAKKGWYWLPPDRPLPGACLGPFATFKTATKTATKFKTWNRAMMELVR